MAVGFGYLIFVIAAFMASIYSLIWVTSALRYIISELIVRWSI
jgi:hypothetical protein